MKHTLKVVSGDTILQEHELTKRQVVIGRDPASDVVTDHPAISRRHAQLTLVDGGYILEDLHSKAGVVIDGMKITHPVPLNHGDRFEICQQMFVYHCPSLIASEREGESESTLLGSIAAVASTDSMSEVDADGKLRAMLRIAQALGRTLDLELLLSKMLDGLFDVFLQADRALILLCDGDRLVPKAAKNRSGISAIASKTTTFHWSCFVEP
ncbi:MAG: FHA domain-containing protein [Candidatus Nealsonbacteria bacterium]|nr:FHA domain-containing protein [Candidatus Nealsonbacteria bacterium]